jgi:UPF0755 protein
MKHLRVEEPKPPAFRPEPKHKPKPKSKLPAILISCIIAAVVIAVGCFVYFFVLTPPQKNISPGIEVEVNIPDGSSTKEIANLLEEKEVVDNKDTFLAAVESRGEAENLKSGTYKMFTLMPVQEIIDALVAGTHVDGAKLSIPEGLTIKKTAELTQKASAIPVIDFLKAAKTSSRFESQYPFLKGAYAGSLEGYLYPETYYIEDGKTVDEIISIMLEQFSTEIDGASLSSEGNGVHSFAELITIASIIEKETKVPEEKAIIASVIENRLAAPMRLQMDDTVIYALGDAYKGGQLTYDQIDLAKSPYNTYKIDGLPPGPICSPGIDSIIAAFNPAKTDYLYYVLKDKQGHHEFCTTSKAFNKAKARYKKMMGLKE